LRADLSSAFRSLICFCMPCLDELNVKRHIFLKRRNKLRRTNTTIKKDVLRKTAHKHPMYKKCMNYSPWWTYSQVRSRWLLVIWRRHAISCTDQLVERKIGFPIDSIKDVL
jgi:hypothetical protein